MTKETPELLTECWQLLLEYVPRREQQAAAEHLITYLTSVLDKDELQAIIDLDSDLSDAYEIVNEDEEEISDYDSDEEYEDED